MKKSISLLILAALSICIGHAQTSPDRVIVKETSGMYKGFLAERIEEITFDKIEGRVAADVEILNVEEGDNPSLSLAITRTEECQSFRIGVIPPKAAAFVTTDEGLANYLENVSPTVYYDDFTNAKMDGFNESFVPDADYIVATIGYDKYGIACSGSRKTFHTAAVPVVGNPVVTCTILDIQQKEFTIKFEPNEDVSEYYLCAFDKNQGDLDEQFAMWGPMFGCNTPDEMIVRLAGSAHVNTYTNTWTNESPSTDYEIYAAILDAEGNFAPRAKVELTTLGYGGEGTSEINIEVGEFQYQADADTYTQRLIYTANDQTNFFRDILIEKGAIEENFGDEAGLVEYLKIDQPMNPYWNQYQIDDWQWVINPGTTYIAYAIGQNANGEWGTLAKKEFTTPEGQSQVKGKTMPRRISVATKGYTNGASMPMGMPKFAKKKAVTLK